MVGPGKRSDKSVTFDIAEVRNEAQERRVAPRIDIFRDLEKNPRKMSGT